MNDLIHIVEKSRELMQQRTIQNGAPAWDLTEISVKKGRDLAHKHGLNPDVISIALYLAHIVFSSEIGGEIQKNHEKLSADEAIKFLKEWGVSDDVTQIIINSIQAHHNKISTQYSEAEIVKNAECYKFISIEGAFTFIHNLGIRGMSYDDAVRELFRKYKQKKSLLTLPECIQDAEVFGQFLKEHFTGYDI